MENIIYCIYAIVKKYCRRSSMVIFAVVISDFIIKQALYFVCYLQYVVVINT